MGFFPNLHLASSACLASSSRLSPSSAFRIAAFLHPHPYARGVRGRESSPRFCLPTPQIFEMSNWQRSSITHAQLQGLASAGLLPPLTEAEEWRKPGAEDFPMP